MRRLVLIAAVGCHAGSSAQHASEPMPLPGESSGASAIDPNFRLDPKEHPGRLSEMEIDTVLQDANPAVTTCYQQVLAVAPEVQGTATTIFIIGTDGAVTAAASSGVDARLGRCIDGVVARGVFPPPRGGTVKVRYPFTFSRSGGGSEPPAATTSEYHGGMSAPPSTTKVTCGRRH